ncbi:MAG: hypothetical protein HY763_07680, partial [Planctomycetes bacterium]|nr:hypothetical protein [Planctomycetota bacterium]
ASTNALCGNFRLDNVAVNQSGTWTVRVRTHESWVNCGFGFVPALLTGAYTLAVCNSNGAPIPIAYGQTLASAFAADCQIVNFSFTGSSGDVVSAFYAGPTSTRRLRLFDPAGVEIGSSASGVTVGIFDEVLLANGTYRLWAEALDNDAVGAFGISLTELDGAVPIAFNTPVNTSISQTAEVDLYAFNGVAGSFVTVDYATPLTAGGFPDHFARLDLIRPDGTVASTNALCGNFRLDNVAVNQSGTWTVRVRTHESWVNCGFGFVPALLTGATH